MGHSWETLGSSRESDYILKGHQAKRWLSEVLQPGQRLQAALSAGLKEGESYILSASVLRSAIADSYLGAQGQPYFAHISVVD